MPELQDDWAKEIVAAALRGDRATVQHHLEEFVQFLIDGGVRVEEALRWAHRVAMVLGTKVTLPPFH